MKTTNKCTVLLLTVLLIVSCVSPEKNSSEYAASAIFSNRDDALKTYQNGLQSVLDVIPVDAPHSGHVEIIDAIKNILYPNTFWGYVDKSGQIYALSPGHKAGLWVLFIDPDHPDLKIKSPTLTTGEQDSLIAVTVRPDLMTERWAGIFLMHELTHGLEKLYMKDADPSSSEYIAYVVEMKSYNLLTNKNLDAVLDKKLSEFSLASHEQLLSLYDSDKDRLYDFLYDIDEELNEPKSKSRAEEEMRIGFYLMAATIRIGQINNYSIDARISNLNQVLEKSSMYKVNNEKP